MYKKVVSGRKELLDEYCTLRKEVKEAVREKKLSIWNEVVEKVNPFMGGDYYAERILWAGILHALIKCYILSFSVMIINFWLLEHAHRHCRNPKSV